MADARKRLSGGDAPPLSKRPRGEEGAPAAPAPVNATHAALLELRGSWSTVVRALPRSDGQLMSVCGTPTTLHSQLLASLGPTRVDVELSALCDARVCRLCHAPIRGGGETSIILCEDLATYVGVQCGMGGGGGGRAGEGRPAPPSTSAPHPPAPSVDHALVVQALHFFSHFANGHTSSAVVGEADVVASFAAWVAAGRPMTVLQCAQGLGGDGGGAPARSPGPPTPLRGLLPCLLSRGLLLRRVNVKGAHGSVGGFHFGVPESGKLMEFVRCGRKELVHRLSKCTHKEMPRGELVKVNFRTSPLPTDFHIRDCVGKALVRVVDTAAGPFVRLVA